MAAALNTKELLKNPFGRGHPASDATKQFRLSASQPDQFSRPERSPEHAAGALLDRELIEFLAQLRGFSARSAVGPCVNRRQRIAGAINPEEAVPKAGAGDDHPLMLIQGRLCLAKTITGCAEQFVRIELGAMIG